MSLCLESVALALKSLDFLLHISHLDDELSVPPPKSRVLVERVLHSLFVCHRLQSIEVFLEVFVFLLNEIHVFELHP